MSLLLSGQEEKKGGEYSRCNGDSVNIYCLCVATNLQCSYSYCYLLYSYAHQNIYIEDYCL